MSDDELTPGAAKALYVTDPMHAFLAADAYREEGPNIGANGEHLSLVVLSLNRSQLTIRLLESLRRHVPGFGGEILVADNGSEPREVEAIRRCLAETGFTWRVVEFGRNLGVARGRNEAVAVAERDWIMSLDNDLYFLTNPLPAYQADIARLGCHFLGLTLLNPDERSIFICGGHLQLALADTELRINAGSATLRTDVRSAFLSTFLSGAASIFNKRKFQEVGGFDVGMFVGFEDLEFSVRLFQEGLKIGASPIQALVHDHAPPETDADLAYERERHSQALLRQSALHFEEKHGFRVWSRSVEEWLEKRVKDMEAG